MGEYQLGQYNKIYGPSDAEQFMSPITRGTATRIDTKIDINVTGRFSITFSNEAISGLGLIANHNYYFHGKIKRSKLYSQSFNVKLINPLQESSEYQEQYITYLNVAMGAEEIYNENNVENTWADVEFIFSPVMNFDTLVFELNREARDFHQFARYPKIAYEELSEIKNSINFVTKNTDNKSIMKIGVQSRPNLLMCINGEAIRTSKTGIYELKNGIITTSFFSVCSPSKELHTEIRDPFPTDYQSDFNMREWMYYVNKAMQEYENDWSIKESKGLVPDDKNTMESNMRDLKSKCFFDITQEYNKKAAKEIDAFTLDYLYYKN